MTWCYKDGADSLCGPFGQSVLKAHIAAGRITSSTMVRKAGVVEWERADRTELSRFFSGQANAGSPEPDEREACGNVTLLLMLPGGGIGDYRLDGKPLVLGSADDCGVFIQDGGASAHHAQLCLKDGAVHVEDLGSECGTKLNGLTVLGAPILHSGDVIQVGQWLAEIRMKAHPVRDRDHIENDYETHPPRRDSDDKSTKACPFCSEEVLVQAKKCKHCGEFLDEELREKAEAQQQHVSYNPIHQVQAFIRWFTGLGRLHGFRFGQLFSGVFKIRSREETEAYIDGCGYATCPRLADVPVEWPRPWYFSRLLISGLLVLLGFHFGLNHFENFKLFPGLIIVGAFFVPLACGTLFFEYNVLRNISIYQTIKHIVVGGILSLIAALFLFQFSGLAETFLGATSAGIVEETAKLAAAIFLARGRPQNGWTLNGMVIGASVGVGFAGFETAGYIFETMLTGSSAQNILILRAVFAPFGHVVWTAVTAGALWRVRDNHPFNVSMLFNGRFLRVFAFVVLLHMLWNSGLLWSVSGASLAYGWMLSVLGSWYLALLLIQEGLNQVKDAKEAQW